MEVDNNFPRCGRRSEFVTIVVEDDNVSVTVGDVLDLAVIAWNDDNVFVITEDVG